MPSKPPPRGGRKSGAGLAPGTPAASSTPQVGTPSGTPAPDSLVDQLNYADIPRPFKNPGFGKTSSNRRPKTAKQIIQIERERYMKPKKKGRGAVASASAAATARGTPVDGMDLENEQPAQAVPEVNDEVVRKEQYIAYHEYEAPPSLRPPKKYCDVTGLEAPYTDPKSRLRYHNADIYELLKGFSSGAEQEYLSLRGQGTVIR